MYKEFQQEQFNRETIENEIGFIVYNHYSDQSAYIHILYVKPLYRQEGIGKELEQKVIAKHNIKTLYCYVDLTSVSPELSLKAILGAGYKISETTKERIVCVKTIK